MSFSKKIVPLLVAGAVAVGLAAVPAASASATSAKTGIIHVQLVTKAGKVIHKSNVSVGWGTSASGDGKLTGPTGAATFRVPVYSKYVVTAQSKDQYFGSHRSGIKVVKGKTTQVRVVLYLGATISGTVSKTAASVNPSKKSPKAVGATTPFAGAMVQAYDASGVFSGGAAASSTGKYTLTGLKTGSYRVQFNYRASQASIAGYPSPFHGGASLASATPIAVTQQSATHAGSAIKSVNATLEQYNATSGTANFADTDYAVVELINDAPSEEGLLNGYGSVVGGAYSTRVAPGGYKAFVTATNSQDDNRYYYFYNGVRDGGVNLTPFTGRTQEEFDAARAASTSLTFTAHTDYTLNLVWGGYPSQESPSPEPSSFSSPDAALPKVTEKTIRSWLNK